MLKALPCLGLCLLAACTSLRTLESTDPERLEQELEPGDRVVVTTADDRRHELELVSVGAGELVGWLAPRRGERQEVRLPMQDLRTVQVKELSIGRTIGFAIILEAVFLALFLQSDPYDFDFY